MPRLTRRSAALTRAIDSRPEVVADKVATIWPDLGRAAGGVGVRSFSAVPLHSGVLAVGSLNLYSGCEKLPDMEPDLLAVIVDYLERGLRDDQG
jgi:hypothetical protein